MTEEIEFESSEDEDEDEDKKKKKPEEETNYKEVTERLEKLEKQLGDIAAFIAKLQEEKKPEDEDEDKKKKPEEEESKELKKDVESIKAKQESLSKTVEKIKNTPVKISQPTNVSSLEELSKRKEELSKEITGAEMLVWAEKNDKEWGKGEV